MNDDPKFFSQIQECKSNEIILGILWGFSGQILLLCPGWVKFELGTVLYFPASFNLTYDYSLAELNVFDHYTPSGVRRKT